MELAAQEPRVIGDFNDFHQCAIGGLAAENHAHIRKAFAVGIVEFVAVAVAFVDIGCFVGFESVRPFRNGAGIRAEAHGPSLVAFRIAALHGLFAEIVPFGHQVDELVLGERVEFFGVGFLDADDVAGEFDDRALHTEADPEEGHIVFTGIPDGFDFPFDAAVPEAAGHEDAVSAFEGLCDVFGGHLFGIHIAQIHGDPVGDAAMHQRFVKALVGFLQFDILADDGDGDPALRILDVVDQLFPRLKLGVAGGQAQHDGDLLIQPFLIEFQGQFVDVAHIHGGKHGVLVHIAEQGDFGAEVGGDGLFAAAEDDVRLDADRTELLDAVLRGLGLVFSGGTEIGHERQMDVQAIVAAQFGAELADGFKEGEAFDIAHRAADFDDGDVGSGIFGLILARLRMAFLISSVIWGITCTVPPR